MKVFLLLISIFCLGTAFGNNDLLRSDSQLKEKIKEIEALTLLKEEEKEALLTLYKKTLTNLNEIESNKLKNQQFVDSSIGDPEKIKQLKKQLKQQEQLSLQAKGKLLDYKNQLKKLTLNELKSELNLKIATQLALNQDNNALKEQLEIVSGNLSNLKQQLNDTLLNLDSISEEQKAKANIEKTDDKSTAYQWLLESQIQVLRSKKIMLEQQILTHPIRLELLRLKQEISTYKKNLITLELEAIEEQINVKQSSEIKKTQLFVQQELDRVKGRHSIVQLLAEKNAKLSQDISKKNDDISNLKALESDVLKETERLQGDYKRVKKKLEVAGLSKILGQMLLEQKKGLPDKKQYLNNVLKRESLITDSALQHIQYQEELEKIKDKAEYLNSYLENLTVDEKKLIETDIINLINLRYQLLEKAVLIHEDYLRVIGDLDYAEKTLISDSDNYVRLLDEHLFWLRSVPPLSFGSFKHIPEHLIALLSIKHWAQLLKDYLKVISSSIEFIAGIIFIFLLLFNFKHIINKIITLGIKTKKISNDNMAHTWKSVLLSFLLSIPIPLFIWLSSNLILNYPGLSDFTYSIGYGLQVIFLPSLALTFFYYLCIPGGVAEIHFKWSVQVTISLKKEIKLFSLTILPAMFITASLISNNDPLINEGIGRFFFMFTLVMTLFFYYRFVKQQKNILSQLEDKEFQSVFTRYHNYWFYLGGFLFFGLISLAALGYVYTAEQLSESLFYTLWFILALILLQQISVRWLLLSQRRYALKVAFEKRQVLQEQIITAQKNEDELFKDELKDRQLQMDQEEHEIDMQSLSYHSRQLLNLILFTLGLSGFIFIWADVLPAFSLFNKIELWHYKGINNGIEQLLPVTLKDLAIATLILIVTIFGAKRFPAIIEIILIQYTNVTSGSRYTITTLINYIIIAIGFISIFNILGAEWSKFQWLFAALGVGIGFGLQEIVANFISGLIILFERPVRVGDYVCVGENEGVVTRIQIRATTILTYDRKELLVPNKEFITGQLINLSLTDPTARIIIAVGIAYGSDVAKSKKLLLEAAKETEHVLNDPEPKTFFHSFGDNSLNMELRCYIDNVDLRMRTISNINELVNNKFNAAGIEISFPQRDVHLDFKQPLDINITRE